MPKIFTLVLLLLAGLSKVAGAQNLTDLVIVAPFNLPTTVQAGGLYPMSAVIKNQGTNGSQFNCIGFYLSTNATWDANDAFLGTSCQGLMFPGQSGPCSITATIPAGTVPGNYYLVLVADPLNAEPELNENNNVVSFALTVAAAGATNRPDLTLWRPSISFNAVPAGGSTGSFTFINNVGTGSVGAYEIGYFLSTDTVFSASTDVFMGLVTGSNLPPSGGTVHSIPILTVPATTTPGNYYLVLMVDPRNLVVESNENNNSRALPLRVTGSPTGTAPAAAPQLAVYPNPAGVGAPLTVLLPGFAQAADLRLHDALGREVTRMAAAGPRTQLPTQGLPAGVYVLRATGPGLNATQRVLLR
ncbi:CARDB domain-containing protein [Hymenobacter persicinus]|uniref:T9SS type A sorting domain-containing protein n=1 Tax=Hymenobacter persicinus TaxID=2025506 RepID=A0A4Q5LFY1_9BACT|nr:CARDB domain-containing protein [Hymenobacter persicinus]RYU84351.1 T9SS type A sorting domain-containing protein [Hymenobacter persicinus]